MRIKQAVSLATASVFAAGALAGCGGQQVGGTSAAPSQSSSTGQSGSCEASPMANPKFREALKLAIDMPSIIEGTMGGKADAANTLMAPGPFKPESGLNEWTYDPEAAKALLEEIGWDQNRELDLVYYYGDNATVDFMSAVQQYLAQVGIKVSPRKLEGDLGTQLWTAPADRVNGPSAVDWDIAYGAVGALAPHEYYDRFRSDYPGNSYWPANDEFEALIEQTASTSVVDEQIEAFGEAVAWDNANLPAVPLYYQPVFVVQSDKLDRGDAGYGNEQYNYDWKIETWDVPAGADGTKTLKTNGGAVEFFETPFINPGLHMSTKVLYDHLLVASPDLASAEPQLAEAYEVSEDGKTVTLHMREGLTWHDGEPLTAEDVKFTFELASQVPSLHSVTASTLSKLSGDEAFKNGEAEEITGITVDGSTVTLQFEELDPNVLLTLTQLPPLPKHLLVDADPLQIQQNPYFQSPIGSGPFKVKDVKMGDYTTFEAFDGYWNGRPIIDIVQMYPSGESDPNLVKNVEAGNVDYAYSKSIEDATAVEAVSGMQLHPVDVMYTRLFFVNSFPKC